VFLAEMAAAVPWSVLEAVIALHYPKKGPKGVVGRFLSQSLGRPGLGAGAQKARCFSPFHRNYLGVFFPKKRE
jgi:hypothetical protein